MYLTPPPSPPSDNKLSINDLGDICEEIYEARTKAHDIGLALKVPEDALQSIDARFDDPGDRLREMLAAWLKKDSEPTWQDVLKALRRNMVGHSKLASDIEAKHCATTGQASGQTTPQILPTLDTQLETLQSLQQALQESQELRTREQQDSQRRIRRNSQRIKELTRQVHEKQCTIDEREKQLKAIEQSEQITRAIDQKAPEKMRRGSAASDSNMAYFNSYGSTTVHSYDSDTQEWNRLPATPHTHFTLVVIQHKLTMVGGMVGYMMGGVILREATNSLLSLVRKRDKKWLSCLPAMPTKRYLTAVVYSGHSLIVAGGANGGRGIPVRVLTTVEVLDTDTRQWSIASSLTHPFSLATISICGERLYMLGGLNQTGETCSVLSCSVPELLQSCQPQPLKPAYQSIIWQCVADVPHYYSSCATLSGQLIAVGGYHEIYENIRVIIVYNERTDSWEHMTDMPTARRLALVAILNGKIMVVGGENRRLIGNEMDVVEIL